MKRIPSIEFYRCLLMFGICLLHAWGQGPHAVGRWGHGLSFCVVGFVAISGWFGVRFTVSKILRLVLTAIWCSAVICSLLGMPGDFWRVAKTYWFVWAYLFMMSFAPIVDAACEKGSLRRCLLPMTLCVFGWGTLVSNHLTSRFFPHEPGLAPYSGVTLLGVYATVRFLKTGGWLDRLSFRVALSLAVISAVFVFGGVYQYNSPFCLVLSVSLLVIFSRISVGEGWFAKGVNLIAPSMFTVYLYHTGPFFGCIRSWERMMVEQWGIPIFFTWLVMAIFAFAGGVVLDIPRRIIVRICKPTANLLYRKLDV